MILYTSKYIHRFQNKRCINNSENTYIYHTQIKIGSFFQDVVILFPSVYVRKKCIFLELFYFEPLLFLNYSFLIVKGNMVGVPKSTVYKKLATLVEGDPKARFSITTTLMCRGGHYSFPWIAPLTLDTYLILLSAKQSSIKYHFLSFWYDLTWD